MLIAYLSDECFRQECSYVNQRGIYEQRGDLVDNAERSVQGCRRVGHHGYEESRDFESERPDRLDQC